MSSSRPRPKPRPKPKTLPNAPVSSTSATSAGSSTPVKSSGATDDDDDLFIRHDPNRIAATYSQQKKARAHSPVPATQDVTYFNNHDNSEDSPESKRRRKEQGGRSKPLPAWTYQTREVPSLPIETDSDSSGPEILDDIDQAPSQPLAKPKLRERSITPPPDEIRYQASSQAQAILSNIYHDDEREVTPEGESQDVIELLPELAAIQRNARATSAAPELSDNRQVELHVKWIPHPEKPQHFEQGEHSWTFQVPQNKPFSEVRRMLTGIQLTSLPVLRKGPKRLFDGGTPGSLFVGTKLEIQAMTLATHQYFEERHLDPSSAPPGDDVDEEIAINSREGSPAATEEKISLKLRAGPKDNNPTTVRVLSNSTVGDVVAAFLNKIGRPGAQGVRLQNDGEDLDMEATLADAELEDGDLVEVVGIQK
ncbi:ubiquitin-like Rad60 SUMO-like protein [Ceratobasidium sp. AG-Ba]|nr:ubiquitin-like Rad60 SUMO-like protein [Ceratobasidium sp. AG-Ba]